MTGEEDTNALEGRVTTEDTGVLTHDEATEVTGVFLEVIIPGGAGILAGDGVTSDTVDLVEGVGLVECVDLVEGDDLVEGVKVEDVRIFMEGVEGRGAGIETEVEASGLLAPSDSDGGTT